jgi:HlyD family secretion protein
MTEPAPRATVAPARPSAIARAVRRYARPAVTSAVVLAVAAAAGYARFFAPVPVTSHRVERGVVVERVFGRGTIESEREAQVGFDLVGRLSEVLVEEGARVTLGQALARLTPEQVEADLLVASRGVASARTSLGSIAAEERRVTTAIEVAEREERRARGLRESGAIPQRDLDLATDQVRLARADLDRVLAQRREATRGIEVAAGGAEQRRVTVLRATLLAPFDGLVTRRLREPGDTVAIGTTVLRVVDTEQVHVSAWIDETVLARLHEDQPAEIVLPGIERTVPGQVRRVGWESDRQTHELLVEVTPAAPFGRIAIGQRADVWIELRRESSAVRVPSALVAHDASGPYCNVDREGRIVRARIRTGIADRELVEVLDGVSEGDLVLGPAVPGAALPEGRRWRAP